MPITLLHLGILAPINHWLPGKVNNLSFWLVTLWLDASAIAYYALGLEMGEFHGPETHSFIAAAAIAGVVTILGMFYISLKYLWQNVDIGPQVFSWTAGAFLGGMAHILLDAMVHSEMLPIHPLPGNPFYWGGMEPVTILLVPLVIWLTSQYALGGVQAVQRSRVVARLLQR